MILHFDWRERVVVFATMHRPNAGLMAQAAA